MWEYSLNEKWYKKIRLISILGNKTVKSKVILVSHQDNVLRSALCIYNNETIIEI